MPNHTSGSSIAWLLLDDAGIPDVVDFQTNALLDLVVGFEVSEEFGEEIPSELKAAADQFRGQLVGRVSPGLWLAKREYHSESYRRRREYLGL